MSKANPLWGAPRIHGELLKLGIEVSQATVAKYMSRQGRPPSQSWRTFLENNVQQIVATDFLVVRTVSFRWYCQLNDNFADPTTAGWVSVPPQCYQW
jgi:hypothetical protein